jgi:hypothetical protein
MDDRLLATRGGGEDGAAMRLRMRQALASAGEGGALTIVVVVNGRCIGSDSSALVRPRLGDAGQDVFTPNLTGIA